MGHSETEAKILAALTLQAADQTVDELCKKTGLPARAVRNLLRQLEYAGQVEDRRYGWRITMRGRRSVSSAGYKDAVAEIRSR